MAQAARLNLRMQKELKLLLTDPPPGVSLPMLSADSADHSTSLSSIDAQIEGPEGTVYARGIFNIKIQIPDRYPFQPPNVTFGTPIYHPNIDNGGRICLDILNLPPKGAWQPSLNISTVLTSIGLLLSEPNPDDGLMCDVSREYKYNRQTFDQKARSMTDRYAKSGASGNGSGSGSIPANPNPSTMEVEGLDLESKNVDNEYNLSCKKLRGVSRKLSLESSGSSQRNSDDKENMVYTHKLSAFQSQRLSMTSSKSLPMPKVPQAGNHNEQPPHQDHVRKAGNDSINVSPTKLCGISQNLLQNSSGLPERRNSDDKENVVQTHQSLLSYPKIISMAISKSQPTEFGNCLEQPHQDYEGKVEDSSINAGRKKLCGIAPKQLLESSCSSQRRDAVCTRKLSLSQSQSLSLASSKLPLMPQNGNSDGQQPRQDHNGKSEIDSINMSCKKLCGINQKLSLESPGMPQRRDGDDKENVLSNWQSTLSDSQKLVKISSYSLSMPQAGKCDEKPLQDHDCGTGKRSIIVGLKKLHRSSQKLLLESSGSAPRIDINEENVLPVQKLSLPHSASLSMISLKSLSMPQSGKHDEHPHQDHVGKVGNGHTKQQEKEATPITEAVIVLDSEDSEEEVKGPTRSRLSLARKHAGKWKANT